jgi:hypothetical protein
VAENDEAAFDPSITSPEQEKKVAGEGNKVGHHHGLMTFKQQREIGFRYVNVTI